MPRSGCGVAGGVLLAAGFQAKLLACAILTAVFIVAFTVIHRISVTNSVDNSKKSLANSLFTQNYPNPNSSFVSVAGLESKVSGQRLNSLRHIDEQLIYAKREIERASVLVEDDPELYAPLFKNVSVFKKSYELMEKILKVHIYQDGPVPLFRTPVLSGIYSSEGWFMRLMVESETFVANDPNKAHLFYLPYSSLQLRKKLVVEKYKIEPMSLFIRNYVNMIAAKYPFWNRTGGADHFIVACHDWAPQTTMQHDELRLNSIKALCNADVSQGVFVQGRDVSLPTTHVRIPRKPRRDVGGKAASKRVLLAFFAGYMHGPVRPVLLKFWKDSDKDIRVYEALPPLVARKTSYIQHMKSSKFCICPKGYEVHSPRIVEAIYYECIPVIIADNYILPFDQVLNWSAFSVVVAEKDIPNLKKILLGISPEEYETMQRNVKQLQKHFLWNEKPKKYDIFHMILHSIWLSRLHQIQVQ